MSLATTRNRTLTLAGLAALVALAACATGGPRPGQTTQTDWPASGTGTRPAATVKGVTITLAELDAWIKEDLFRRELGSDSYSDLYQLRSTALERMIDEQLLAREAESRGLDPAVLLQTKVDARGPVTDQEVQDFYQANKNRVQGVGDVEEIAEGIRGYLEQLRSQQVIAELRDAASVTIELERPRRTVTGHGASRGPADAAVVIVEFSDYQCPFCRRAETTLNEILRRYPNDVRWEYRHYPLPNHPAARPAAEAAVCAQAQGSFWAYHEKLFGQRATLDAGSLRRYAEEVGLDLAQFEACQQGPTARERVAADLRAGRLAGASGTPAFFVNGIFLSGARPIEQFEKLIQAELAKAPASN